MFTIRFFKRTSDNKYEDLINFENYKQSFELPQDEVEQRHWPVHWPVMLSPRVKLSRGGRKTKKQNQKAKPKTQKAKSKTQNPKSKKTKSKKQ
jgi:hypothetical protein